MGKAVRLDRFLADSGAGTRTEVKKLEQGQSLCTIFCTSLPDM